MTDDRRSNSSPKKNPTFAISVFIVVVVLLVVGTLFFNAIREKREYDRENGEPAAVSGASPAVPALGASQPQPQPQPQSPLQSQSQSQ